MKRFLWSDVKVMAEASVLEIVPKRVLVLFRPEQHRFGPVSEHFLFRHRTMRSVFARYLRTV